MENSRKVLKTKTVGGYLLLEGLLTLGLLALLVTGSLAALNQSNQARQQLDRQISALNLAQMALQAHLSAVTENQMTVKIVRKPQEVLVLAQGKEVLRLHEEN